MRKDLMHILACPVCKSPLELTITAAGVPAFMLGFEAWKQVTGPNKFDPKV